MPAIVTSLIFYMQIRVEKKYKAFAYRNYRHFTQQCSFFFQKPKTGQLEAVVSEMKFYILVQSGMWLILAVG